MDVTGALNLMELHQTARVWELQSFLMSNIPWHQWVLVRFCSAQTWRKGALLLKRMGTPTLVDGQPFPRDRTGTTGPDALAPT